MLCKQETLDKLVSFNNFNMCARLSTSWKKLHQFKRLFGLFLLSVISCIAIYMCMHTSHARAIYLIRPKTYSNRSHKLYGSDQIESVKKANKNIFEIRHEFEFIRDLPAVCTSKDGNTAVDLFVFISSSTEHRSQRKSLRDSWLLYFQNNTSRMRYVFILGETHNKTLLQDILQEAEVYNDIVIANFQDTYKNLTLKTIAGFHWANKHCPHARFVMKADDDVYVNIPSLLNVLVHENEDYSLGKLWKNGSVVRNEHGKWYISYEEYPNKTYPDYYSGPGYVLSMKHVRGILHIYRSVDFLPFEDVFVGLCLKRLGVALKDRALYLSIRTPTPLPLCVYKYSNVVLAHEVPGALMKTIIK